MKRLITWAREAFCRHQWRTSPFMALTLGSRPSQKCTKCGKWRDLP